MLDAMETVGKSLSDIEWPFLILHGEPDTLTSVKGSKLMFEKAKSKDKKLKVGYHKDFKGNNSVIFCFDILLDGAQFSKQEFVSSPGGSPGRAIVLPPASASALAFAKC